MSWVEVKKINSNFKKSLDVLLKEQFSSNNSNVNNIKNDINYIKNNQIGTDINAFLNNLSVSSSLKNTPLVNKINALLIMSDKIKYISGEDINLIGPTGYYGLSGTQQCTVKYSGYLKVSAMMRGNTIITYYVNSESKGTILINDSFSDFEPRNATIYVNAGDVLKFNIGAGTDKFKVSGSIVFSN